MRAVQRPMVVERRLEREERRRWCCCCVRCCPSWPPARRARARLEVRETVLEKENCAAVMLVKELDAAMMSERRVRKAWRSGKPGSD